MNLEGDSYLGRWYTKCHVLPLPQCMQAPMSFAKMSFLVVVCACTCVCICMCEPYCLQELAPLAILRQYQMRWDGLGLHKALCHLTSSDFTTIIKKLVTFICDLLAHNMDVTFRYVTRIWSCSIPLNISHQSYHWSIPFIHDVVNRYISMLIIQICYTVLLNRECIRREINI